MELEDYVDIHSCWRQAIDCEISQFNLPETAQLSCSHSHEPRSSDKQDTAGASHQTNMLLDSFSTILSWVGS